MDKIFSEFSTHMRVFGNKLLGFIPDLLVMLTIITAGLLAAWVAKHVLVRLLRAAGFDVWCDEVGIKTALEHGGIKSPPVRVIGIFAFWLILIIFMAAGLGSLGIEATRGLAAGFFMYLPRFLSAIVILVIGYILSGFLERAALLAGVNAGIGPSSLIAKGVRLIVVVFVFAMALEQLAIAPRIVLAAFSILFGGIALAAAIAFGYGGRDTARKIIEEMRHKRKKSDIEPL